MEQIIELLKANLCNVVQAMLIFVCAYLANMCFSLYLNIKILKQPFDKNKILTSLIKAVVFIVGLTLLTSVITVLPIFAEMMGWEIPAEFTEIFSGMVIVFTFLYVSAKYTFEAVQKFMQILNYKKEEAEKNKAFDELNDYSTGDFTPFVKNE